MQEIKDVIDKTIGSPILQIGLQQREIGDPTSVLNNNFAVEERRGGGKAADSFGDRLEAIGKKTPINTENAWTSSLFHWFDSSKAKIELGFQPRSADEALAESVDWMKENGLI